MDCSTPGFLSITTWSSNSTESVMPSNHLIPCHPLFLPSSVFPSIRVFSNESTLHIRWPKYWSFSFNISPFNVYWGQISFRMDWLDFLAVQGTLKSLVQLHSSKASILRRSAFFVVQFSQPYMTTGKTVALTRWTCVSKVMSLLFNLLSRLVITFLPKNKCLLISWLQSPSAVILKPPKIRSLTVSIFPPSICYEVMGPDAMILVFWMFSSKPTLSLSSFTFTKRLFSFCFLLKCGVICMSEVIDISSGNLDSSLCFIQSSISWLCMANTNRELSWYCRVVPGFTWSYDLISNPGGHWLIGVILNRKIDFRDRKESWHYFCVLSQHIYWFIQATSIYYNPTIC